MKKIILLLLFFTTSLQAYEVKMVSWNMAMGMFMNSKLLKRRVARKFLGKKKLKGASIINLQEFCPADQGQIDLFMGIMKKKFGSAWIHKGFQDPLSGSNKKDICSKGQAIISAHPILDSGRIQLPVVGHTRVAIWADLLVNGEKIIRIYNVHYSNRDGRNLAPIEGRWTQAQIVLDHAMNYLHQYPDRGIVDFGRLQFSRSFI